MHSSTLLPRERLRQIGNEMPQGTRPNDKGLESLDKTRSTPWPQTVLIILQSLESLDFRVFINTHAEFRVTFRL